MSNASEKNQRRSQCNESDFFLARYAKTSKSRFETLNLHFDSIHDPWNRRMRDLHNGLSRMTSPLWKKMSEITVRCWKNTSFGTYFCCTNQYALIQTVLMSEFKTKDRFVGDLFGFVWELVLVKEPEILLTKQGVLGWNHFLMFFPSTR